MFYILVLNSFDSNYILSSNILLFISDKSEKIYKDPLNQRNLIYKENKEKIGVYAWYNNINGKIYVGSGDPLYRRISDYYQQWYIESKANLYIVKAISKYNLANYTLFILDYSTKENLLECEQK